MTSQTLGESAARPGSTPGRAAAPAPAKPRGHRFAPAPLIQKLATLIVVLLAWQWFAKGPGADADFPTPLVTLETARQVVVTSSYWEAVLSTMINAAAGFLISVAIGVPFGLAIGSYRRARMSSQFLVDFGRTIPGTAIIPIMLLVFGNTRTMAVGLVVFGAVWPLIVQATYAAQQMSPQLRQVAKAFRLSPLERLRYIFAPQALPFLMTGLRVAAAISLILAVTAEYFGQSGGIGFQLFQMHEIHDPPRLFVYMFTAAVLGVLLNVLLIATQRRALWWHPSERQKARR